ncbi:hypothetical protein GCM10027044_08550 [Hymenobacter ruber]
MAARPELLAAGRDDMAIRSWALPAGDKVLVLALWAATVWLLPTARMVTAKARKYERMGKQYEGREQEVM